MFGAAATTTVVQHEHKLHLRCAVSLALYSIASTDQALAAAGLLEQLKALPTTVVVTLQEMVRYLQQEGHLEEQGGGMISQPPNLDQLISLLQQSQVFVVAAVPAFPGYCMTSFYLTPNPPC